MKYTLMLGILLLSVSSFADERALVGEGVKEGCDQSQWSCDDACKIRKAKECGVVVDNGRDHADRSRNEKKGAKASGEQSSGQ